ncbi:protease inhibitor I42 family protein [Caproiciproducens sp. MSJ-32]|nr:protease inhibitor I42 family protein [Caproiciproducens sp. MSJ-32]
MLIMLLAFTVGCSENVLLDEQNSKRLNYNFKISDLKNIDQTLSKQRYSYSTNVDKRYVAVITYQSKNATIKQYLVNKDGIVELTIPKDSPFIISLHANRTITYTWNVKNSIDNELIKLENRSWINVPIPKSEKDKDGANYDRQNFYFKSLKSGSEKLVMRYEHQSEHRDEFFEITFKIKIED